MSLISRRQHPSGEKDRRGRGGGRRRGGRGREIETQRHTDKDTQTRQRLRSCPLNQKERPVINHHLCHAAAARTTWSPNNLRLGQFLVGQWEALLPSWYTLNLDPVVTELGFERNLPDLLWPQINFTKPYLEARCPGCRVIHQTFLLIWCMLGHPLSPIVTCLPSTACLVLLFFPELPSGNVLNLSFLIWHMNLWRRLVITNLLMKTARSDTIVPGRVRAWRSLSRVPHLSLGIYAPRCIVMAY